MAKKLTDKERKQVIADYVATGNYCEAARRNGVSECTVRRLVKQDSETTKRIEQKNEKNYCQIDEKVLYYLIVSLI